MSIKLLVCGTRKKGYRQKVFDELDCIKEEVLIGCIIEGCCPDSADVWAEEWVKKNQISIEHFPANSGNYLKRNIEMVDECDMVLAFWDGFSYGTCHTIAMAVMKNKEVKIIDLRLK